jgi:hypothetical protein
MRTDKSSRHLIYPDADDAQPFRVRIRIRKVSQVLKMWFIVGHCLLLLIDVSCMFLLSAGGKKQMEAAA